jgi:uncharacterized circularly permuted ATP-grasp superfamily protein
MRIDWKQYDPGNLYDELIGAAGQPRPAARVLANYLKSLSDQQLARRQRAAELAIAEMGITFTVYSEGENIDRAWPFDIIPRVIALKEWQQIEAGLKQRITALNLFIEDIYNGRRIIKDKVFPRSMLAGSKNYLPQCEGASPRFGVWAHICGSDLVRDRDGTVYVLEDNLRVPSGVSYMIQNRSVAKRVFPELFRRQTILPVDDYPAALFDMLAALSPRPLDYPEIVVLTPGVYNSAYFEHAYLAQQMGAELVEGDDLVVCNDDCVYMRTIDGLQRVDVIYRRVNDEFLDPEAFREDSILGCRGLLRAWRAGNVALANAPGCGVADDKMVYTYVPDFIRYYLDQDPILPNVPSYRCNDPKEREFVLANLKDLVIKPANESGGYGMLVGPQSTAKEREKFARLVQRRPRNYIAQPALSLSTAPTVVGRHLEPRHLDLRPFILSSGSTYVTAGGLTRVALRKGSLVVNSSQGGGSKDTWVLDSGGKR